MSEPLQAKPGPAKACRVVLKRPGKRTRRLLVQGAEPKKGDTIRIDGLAYQVHSVEPTEVIAAFKTDDGKLKQVFP